MVMQNMCFIILITSQYVNNRHANKKLVNSENWSLNECVTGVSDALCIFIFPRSTDDEGNIVTQAFRIIDSLNEKYFLKLYSCSSSTSNVSTKSYSQHFQELLSSIPVCFLHKSGCDLLNPAVVTMLLSQTKLKQIQLPNYLIKISVHCTL